MRKVKRYFRNVYPWAVAALERDHFQCRECGSDSFVIVHHIDNSRKNGIKNMNNNLENLISLCKMCHAEAHGQTMKYANPNNSLVLEMRKQGKKLSFIASHLGISRQRVSQIMHRDKNYSPEDSLRKITWFKCKCENCGKEFQRRSGKGYHKESKHIYCSRKCYGLSKRGYIPWNKGLKYNLP